MKRICPKRALLIGMTHEFDHHKDNEFLSEWSKRYTIHVFFVIIRSSCLYIEDTEKISGRKKEMMFWIFWCYHYREGIPVQLARDGLRLPIDLWWMDKVKLHLWNLEVSCYTRSFESDYILRNSIFFWKAGNEKTEDVYQNHTGWLFCPNPPLVLLDYFLDCANR